MLTIGNVVNLILLLVVLVLAGEWSFGLYGAAAGLALAIAIIIVVIRLQRASARERRFDPTGGSPTGGAG